MCDEDLIHDLQNNHKFNPWLDVAEDWRSKVNACQPGYEFILESDLDSKAQYHAKLVRHFTRKLKKAKNSEGQGESPEDAIRKRTFRLDILPQPFIGNPCSPVWVLLRNPGYSEADVYDLKSIEEGRRRLSSKSVTILDTFGQSPEEALRTRQQLVCNQLKFEFERDKEFYILRREFNTVKDDGTSVWGGYNWYMKYFGCKSSYISLDGHCLKNLSRNVFVLEYIPYHSEQYFNSGVRFTHYELWKRLVSYALESKILVMRGDMYKHITDIVKEKKDPKLWKVYLKAECERRIFVIKGQSAYLTLSNTYWPCSILREINPLLRIVTSNTLRS